MRIVLISLLFLLLAAVSGAQNLPYDGVNPLTGLEVEALRNLNRRPVIVKINNSPPETRQLQRGLLEADLVWEVLLSGGITRFAALFWTNDPIKVGPIRSARLADFSLLRNYKALLVSSGMSIGTEEAMFRQGDIFPHSISGAGPCPALCRDPLSISGRLEYSLYGNLPALRDLAEIRRRDTSPQTIRGMVFGDVSPHLGVPIYDFGIRYMHTEVQWEWDGRAGLWLRSQDGEAHIDAQSNQRISAHNVVILEAPHNEQPLVYENYWGPTNYAFDVPLTGSGRALLFRDGSYVEGYWQRPHSHAEMRFFDTADIEFVFSPGRTFFNLAPRWAGRYQLWFSHRLPLSATINTENVNVRSGPSTNYPIAAFRSLGDSVKLQGRNNQGSWFQFIAGGQLMWVWSGLVDVRGDAMRLPIVRPTNDN